MSDSALPSRSVGQPLYSEVGGSDAPPGPRVGDQGFKIAKVLVGACRFLLEDSLQAVCAGIYLCKQWKHLSVNTQIFTFAQIFGGILFSLIGPLQEYRGLKGSSVFNIAVANDHATGHLHSRVDGDPAVARGNCIMKSVLATYATVFWGSMVAYSFVFHDDISCDGDNPSLGVQLFIGFLVCDLACQTIIGCFAPRRLAILANQAMGYNFWDPESSSAMGIRKLAEGIFFTCLARWDTFSDVVFTARVLDCEDITWFSVKGNVFHIPFGLTVQNIALFALVVGVFLFQALPALLLIACKGLTPLALKFNDFNIIMAAISQ